MDIVVKGRNVDVPEHFRQRVLEKLAPSERLDAKVHRLDVELFHERNPRQASQCQRVEITCLGKGPVIRAEACAADFYAALDAACLKLEARLRKSHDRRRVHHGAKTPPSVAQVTALLPPAGGASSTSGADADQGRGVEPGPTPAAAAAPTAAPAAAGPTAAPAADAGAVPQDDTEHLVVRDKTHAAVPMSTPQALHEMELVGHDFFLFCDEATGLPSVVYRRHGYDYGVIRLALT